MQPTSVLYVDDDKSIHLMVKDVLTTLGMKVHAAMSTAEADALLAKEQVDIIVCDIQMLPEDGLTYCRRLRAAGNRIPVVLLSAGINTESNDIGLAAGATECISKPFDILYLRKRIQEIAHAPR